MNISTYTYNPHSHAKIWLSNNPDVFMNLENQVRLVKMREKNPKDEICLIYDSTKLNSKAINELNAFCNEHKLSSLDANSFHNLDLTPNERILFNFYQDEINHLNEGGNLAVASDILRWLHPVYEKKTYTDFDFPVDTTSLPSTIEIEAPLLLNIGSLRMGKQEFILSNNDYVAVVDPEAAKKQIERIQQGIIDRLKNYDTDFVEKTEEQLQDNFFNRNMLKFMKNRSESFYISKSKELHAHPNSSRNVRNYIKQIMSDKNKFLDFNKQSPEESDESVIKRLRHDLEEQLTLIKYLFFGKEYTEIKTILKKDNDTFLEYMMKKELNLYLKSIVVCTTGPIQISNALFGGYVVDSGAFRKNVQPLSFNHYNLQKAFRSQNSIPMHESVFGMMRFLGEGEGELNDSSWLESGRKLQAQRTKKLEMRQQQFAENLPEHLIGLKKGIEKHILKLSNNRHGIFFKERRKLKHEALQEVLKCFQNNINEDEFDVAQFQKILPSIYLSKSVFAGLFFSQTKKLIGDLEQLSHEAMVFSLTQNKKIKWNSSSETRSETVTSVPHNFKF
ncbi:glycosyltransferase family 88 protein [Legionella drancourtii]|uniref:glycosyltransferase family 88 protein n=1 Tax=Legionella drancourtii TaxID=168933 RepID=UPI0002FA1965|nr:glycosyltransferase family 88 protein [Legionella drancourtii]